MGRAKDRGYTSYHVSKMGKGEKMTRDEAIEILKAMFFLDEIKQKALQMAIEALERKHGEWIDYEDAENSIYGHVTCRCSVCGHVSQYKENYCMHCGADMRGDTDEWIH